MCGSWKSQHILYAGERCLTLYTRNHIAAFLLHSDFQGIEMIGIVDGRLDSRRSKLL